MKVRFTEGALRSINGRWQLYVRFCDVDEHGERAGEWKCKTQMTAHEVAGGKSERQRAQAELVEWRDALVSEQAVREALAGLGACAPSRPADDERLVKALGIDEAQLARPFDEYAREYVSARARANDSASTVGGSVDILRCWVLPYLPDSSVAVRDLTPADVHGFLAALTKHGYSASTVLKAWKLFRSIVRYAINVHGLRPDPTYGIRDVHQPKPRINYIEPAMADRAALALARMPCTDVVFAARLALACGICLGEVSGLQIFNCDPDRVDNLHVVQVVAMRKGGTVLKAPKTEARERVIPMNDEVRRAVKDRIAAIHDECREAGRPYGEMLYMTGRPDGSYLAPRTLGRKWAAISQGMGLIGCQGKAVSFHDLRHTFATAFLSKGGSFADLKAILGHSTGYMTLEVYASSDTTARAGSMERTGRRLPEAEACSAVALNDLFEFPEGK